MDPTQGPKPHVRRRLHLEDSIISWIEKSLMGLPGENLMGLPSEVFLLLSRAMPLSIPIPKWLPP
jgi:hypothetical protein